MILVPVALFSAAAASLAYFLMKPKNDEYDYDSDDSNMSEDFKNLGNGDKLAGSCKINLNSTFADTKPLEDDSGFQTNSILSPNESTFAPPMMNTNGLNESIEPMMNDTVKGACPLQRTRNPLQPTSLHKSLPHSYKCPIYQNQQEQQQQQQQSFNNTFGPTTQTTQSKGQQMQPYGRGPPQKPNACPLAGRPNGAQNACPLNSGGMDPMVNYRRECIMAICAMRNNLYEGTQKVMQCIHILNGLDHFVRTMK